MDCKSAVFAVGLLFAGVGPIQAQNEVTSSDPTAVRPIHTAPMVPPAMSQEGRDALCTIFNRISVATKSLEPGSDSPPVIGYSVHVDSSGQVTKVMKNARAEDSDFDNAVRHALVGYNVSQRFDGFPYVVTIGFDGEGHLDDSYHLGDCLIAH